MQNILAKTILYMSLITGSHVMTPFALASDIQGDQISLLKSNGSYSPGSTGQPNFSKGEIILPAQAAVVYVVEQPLPDFLRQAAVRNNIQITLSARVGGTLTKMSLPVDMKQIMPQISDAFDLEWHFNKQWLFVSRTFENRTRSVYLGEMSMSEFYKAVSEAGIKFKAKEIPYVKETNSIILNGSEEYISSVEKIAKSYNRTSNEKAQATESYGEIAH